MGADDDVAFTFAERDDQVGAFRPRIVSARLDREWFEFVRHSALGEDGLESFPPADVGIDFHSSDIVEHGAQPSGVQCRTRRDGTVAAGTGGELNRSQQRKNQDFRGYRSHGVSF